MKKVEAYIRRHKIAEVQAALAKLGVTGSTGIAIHGKGRQKGYQECYRGIDYVTDFLPKYKLEIIIDDEQVDACVDAIMEAARTGEIGDGKIIVTPVEKVIRIRTGESGDAAM